MDQFGIDGVLYLVAVAAILLAILAAVRSSTSESPARLARPFELLAPHAAALAHDPPSRPDNPPVQG
jgi:hypothetical protein